VDLRQTHGVRHDHVCPGCGLDYSTISPPDAKVAIRSFGRRYRSALAAVVEDEAEEALVRKRPDATTWSALEYVGHVADAFEFIGSSIRQMFDQDSPTLQALDFEGRVESERYIAAEPRALLDRLDAAATRLAGEVDRVSPDAWHRTATFPFGERDILTMTRNGVHEGSHHLRDVERVLDVARRSR